MLYDVTMENAIIVTQTVTYLPHRYPVKWAQTPDEVPAWDVSRGVKLTGFWQEYPVPKGESALTNGTAADAALSWGGGAAPADSASYPRLVAAKPHLLSGDITAKVKPSQAVAGLTRYIGDASFPERVSKASSAYALMNPERGDTLRGWERFAKQTAFHLFLIQHINAARAEDEITRKAGKKPERYRIKQAFDYADMAMPENARDGALQEAVLESLYLRRRRLKKLEPELAEALKNASLFSYQHLPKTPESAAQQLYAYHWSYFQNSDVRITLGAGCFNAVCGLEAWVRYELALAVNGVSAIGICEGCGTPFFKRGKQTVCDPKRSACRMAAKRTRDALKNSP